MASQEKLREMFNEMNTEQKGAFIENLKKSLEESADVESAQFLEECTEQYAAELEMGAAIESIETEAAELPDSVSEVTLPEPELEAVPDLEPEPEATPSPASEIIPMFDPELEAAPELEPELEPLPGLDPELEAQLEPVLETISDSEAVADPELEAAPELEPELDPELEAAPELEPELDPELEAAPELEPELDPELEAVPDIETELEPEPEPVPESVPELVTELESVLEIGPELEPDPDFDPSLIIEPEPEPEPMPEIEPELDLMPELDVESETESFDIPQEESPATKNKVDYIEMEISELADNIRYKMDVIDAISHLLSDTGSEIIEAVAQAKGTAPTLPLESTSAYEEKVDSIVESISGFADNIRQDMKVMEAISRLLSGEGANSELASQAKSKRVK